MPITPWKAFRLQREYYEAISNSFGQSCNFRYCRLFHAAPDFRRIRRCPGRLREAGRGIHRHQNLPSEQWSRPGRTASSMLTRTAIRQWPTATPIAARATPGRRSDTATGCTWAPAIPRWAPHSSTSPTIWAHPTRSSRRALMCCSTASCISITARTTACC